MKRNAIPYLGILAVFLSLGLLVVLMCPPIWRDNDGLVQISDRPGDMVILHYPPAYPFFSRMHVYAADVLQGWMNGHHASIRLSKVVHLNDAGIHALMVSQEVLLALALTALVAQVARSRGAKWLVVSLLASNAAFFIAANLISTEALAVSVSIALVAISAWNFRTAELRPSGIILYGVVLYIAILTRHAHEVFAMLLPLAFLLGTAREWVRLRRFPTGLAKRCAVFIMTGALCILAAQGTIRLFCFAFNIQYRSISTRATAERLGFVTRMSPEERETFLASLKNSTSDPLMKEAIPLLARHATWVEQRDEIEKILVRQSPDLQGDALKVMADGYLERITNLFFQTHHPLLIKGTLKSIWHALSKTTPTDITSYYLRNGAASIDLYASRPNLSKKTDGLAVCSPAMKDRIEAFQKNPWLRFWAWAPHGLALLSGSVLAVFFLVRQREDVAMPLFALAVASTGVVITCLTFFFVNYDPRYTAATDLFAFLTLAIAAAHWFDSRSESPPAGSTH